MFEIKGDLSTQGRFQPQSNTLIRGFAFPGVRRKGASRF
jgi:hypothetical protein